jgi:hypothetical protein
MINKTVSYGKVLKTNHLSFIPSNGTKIELFPTKFVFKARIEKLFPRMRSQRANGEEKI